MPLRGRIGVTSAGWFMIEDTLIKISKQSELWRGRYRSAMYIMLDRPVQGRLLADIMLVWMPRCPAPEYNMQLLFLRGSGGAVALLTQGNICRNMCTYSLRWTSVVQKETGMVFILYMAHQRADMSLSFGPNGVKCTQWNGVFLYLLLLKDAYPNSLERHTQIVH